MLFFKEIAQDNAEIITYQKVKGRLFLYGFLFLMGLLVFPLTLNKIIQIITTDRIEFDLLGLYIVTIFGLLCFYFTSGFIFGYFSNIIALTATHIIIQRGAFGKLYSIPKEFILAKFPVFTSSKGMDNYQISFFLKNGKRIGSGLLYCKGKEFDKIYDRLHFRHILRKKDIKSEFSQESLEGMSVKRNVGAALLANLPFILAILIVILLISGINEKIGSHNDFEIKGIVLEKRIEKNKSGSSLKLIVLDSETNGAYKMDVTSNVYHFFKKGQGIMITGTKGSLGLLYDIEYFSLE